MRNHFSRVLAALTGFSLAACAQGDAMQAHCGYSSSPDMPPENYQSCVYSQRQGHINVDIGELPTHDFSPDGDTPGTFVNQKGQRVYRKRGLGERGQIFQLPGNYLYVLWRPAPDGVECQRDELTAPKTCTLGDGTVGFSLQSTSGSSLTTLRLTPIGLQSENETRIIELDGAAYMAELADLDSNGWPEVYVYISSAGSGSYGSLVAYAINGGKSTSPIYLPPLSDNAEAAAGFRGHDEFRVVEKRLVRRFPTYTITDTNAAPSGGTRQIQYRLVAGEATWQLEVDRVVDY